MFGLLRPGSPDEQMPISPEISPPRTNSMAPMPPSQFNSREELLESAKQWAAQQGYAIVIARSRFNRLWLKCDRGGQYENRRNLTPEQRKRKRSDSRLLGCPFRMLAVVRKDGVWKVSTENPEHNHGPSEDLSQHPTLRRLTEEQSVKVNEMTEAGNSPAETLEELKRIWPGIKVLTRDIYNARKKYKAQKEMAEIAAKNADIVEEQQEFVDPNETIPGPTPNGRWEWVPEGDSSGKNKRRRRRPPIEQQPLDPALQPNVPNLQHSMSSSSSHRPSSAGYPPSLAYHQPPQQQSQHQQSMLSPTHRRTSDQISNPRHDSAPMRLQQTAGFTSTSSSFDFGPTTDEDPTQSLTNSLFPSPSHHAPLSHQRSSLQIQHQHPAAGPADTGMMQSAVGHGGGFPSNAMGFGAGGGAQIVTATPAGQPQPRVQSGQVIMSRIERMEKEQKDQRVMLAQILGAVQCMQAPTR